VSLGESRAANSAEQVFIIPKRILAFFHRPVAKRNAIIGQPNPAIAEKRFGITDAQVANRKPTIIPSVNGVGLLATAVNAESFGHITTAVVTIVWVWAVFRQDQRRAVRRRETTDIELVARGFDSIASNREGIHAGARPVI